MTMTIRVLALAAILCLLTGGPGRCEGEDATGQAGATAESTAGEDQAGEEAAAEEEIPPPLHTYMGREIAQTMHYAGAPWLVRESREREEECQTMLDHLGIEEGMTVCDMGCGNGFYTLRLAEMVGESGRVLAVDIQSEMLHMLSLRADEEGVENIEPVLGSVVDPRLPVGEVDVILCVDVYHEFSNPEEMLQAMRESLSEDGRVVLVEFRAEDPEVPIKPLHKMSREQIMLELPANGYELVDEFEELPWQHMMFFARTAEDAEGETAPSGE